MSFVFWQELNSALATQCSHLKNELQAIKTENAQEFKEFKNEYALQIQNLRNDVAAKDQKIAGLESIIQTLKKVLEQA